MVASSIYIIYMFGALRPTIDNTLVSYSMLIQLVHILNLGLLGPFFNMGYF